MDLPKIIQFPQIGNSGLGYISVAERVNLPFSVKRIYWTYLTPENVERGGHAHRELEQLLISVAGIIKIKIELRGGEKTEFTLDKPDQGLYIPKMTWRTIQYNKNAVQLCIASTAFDETDYIRDYETFLREC
ncbi:MAG: FdtA/QdtA family cupin domain-containing protein [Ginsengibacter sp.]